jgi:Protein of unknown function (DUF998)
MSTNTNVAAHPVPAGRVDGTTRTRRLLTCGVVAGPFFIILAALQVAFRDGFDLTRHPLSLLSLGDLGWIQITNFVVSGLLSIACAFGVRRAMQPGRGATWGPLLLGVYGVGLVVAGVFVADASMGFPPGAPEGTPDTLSWHAILHGVGTALAFPSLVVACFVVVRRFVALKQRWWAAYSATTGVAALALTAWPDQDGISLRLAIGAVLTFGWLSAIAAHLINRIGDHP